MKRLWFILLSAVCAATLCAAEERPVYCTTFPVYLFTKNLTRDCKNIRVELIVPPGTGCPHDYVLTPADMRKLGTRNLILVRNGLGIDDFVLKPLAKMNSGAVVIDATQGLRTLEEKYFCSCGHDHGHEAKADEHKHAEKSGEHEHGHSHGLRNPHLFASPVTAMGMVENIARGLEKADPANAALYRANAKAYLEKLNVLKKQIAALAPFVKGHAVAAQHGIFDYLAEALGLRVVATISDGQTAPSAAEMKELIHEIKEEKVSVIFTEPQYPARTAKALARECGIRTVRLDPVASGPADAPSNYYEKAMENNLKTIRKVFEK